MQTRTAGTGTGTGRTRPAPRTMTRTAASEASPSEARDPHARPLPEPAHPRSLPGRRPSMTFPPRPAPPPPLSAHPSSIASVSPRRAGRRLVGRSPPCRSPPCSCLESGRRPAPTRTDCCSRTAGSASGSGDRFPARPHYKRSACPNIGDLSAFPANRWRMMMRRVWQNCPSHLRLEGSAHVRPGRLGVVVEYTPDRRAS